MATVLTRQEGEGKSKVILMYLQDVRIIDEARINTIDTELKEIIDNAEGCQNFILNFQNVAFMSSAMIGKLVFIGKLCKQKNCNLRFCWVHDSITEALRLMRFHKVFAIDKEEVDSLRKFAK